MKISVAQNKPLSFFKKNERNKDFFEEEKLDLSSMVEDIKKRGVLVPLVVKEDGTLLAGHCRYTAAKKAGLKILPAQIITDMTDDEEFEYLIKDNAVRRHFTRNDRLKMYRRIHSTFDEDVHTLRKISIQEIVNKTGLNYSTVNGDITRLRKMLIDARKRRTKEENLLILYRRLTTQVRNALITKNVTPDDVKRILTPLQTELRELPELKLVERKGVLVCNRSIS